MIDPARVHALSEPQRRLLARRLDSRASPVDAPERRLVAYLLVTPGARTEPAVLRDALGAALPDYMVPAVFVPLERWPRLASGKIDRQALRAAGRAAAHAPFAPPRTDLERTIADIWRDLLAIDRVGLDDSFFDLGGHSLLLVRLHARLRDALGVDLTIVDLFGHATVRALARLVRSNRPDRSEAGRGGDAAVRERATRQRKALGRHGPGANRETRNRP